jgi:DNA-binding response OmpR family regulator
MTSAKILVVEAEPDLLNGIRDILVLEDYSVETAADGLIALDILENCGEDLPQVILSDWMLPRLDGMQLLQRVRERAEWNSIAFLLITANADSEFLRRAGDLGVTGVLIAPFDVEELLMEINQALGDAF